MKNVQQYIQNFTAYPVSVMFGHIDTPTPKQKKAEKRVAEICEALYRFDCTVLSDVRAAFRELDVLISLSDDKFRIKQVRLTRMTGRLAYFVDKAVVMLDNMHKKDQQLQQYWQPLSMKAKVLKDEIKSFLIQYDTSVDKIVLLSEFDNAYKEAQEEDKK